MGVTNRRPSSDSELISCMEMRLLACVTRGLTREPYQTVSTVYFILGILRMDLWSRVGLKIDCHNQNNMFFGEDNKLEQSLPRPSCNRVFSHDVTAAILVSQNNETAAMLVSQTSPLGVELFSYANAFFCPNKFA